MRFTKKATWRKRKDGKWEDASRTRNRSQPLPQESESESMSSVYATKEDLDLSNTTQGKLNLPTQKQLKQLWIEKRVLTQLRHRRERLKGFNEQKSHSKYLDFEKKFAMD